MSSVDGLSPPDGDRGSVTHVFEDYGGSAKKILPIIYAPLPDKSQQTYERFFM